MKKYTIYEIEKLTDGQMSKYRINKAIESGELLAEKLANEKGGKGVPKFVVYEDELYKWLQTMGDQVKTKINLPDVILDKEKEGNFQENSSKVAEGYERILQEKDVRISELKSFIDNLENRNIPLLMEGKEVAQKRIDEIKEDRLSLKQELEKKNTESENKSKLRQKLILELSSLGIFQTKKKKEILSKLSELA